MEKSEKWRDGQGARRRGKGLKGRGWAKGGGGEIG